MRVIKKISFLLLVALSLAACRPSSPDEVAVKLFNSLTSGDMSYVKDNIYFSNSMEYDVVCDFLDLMSKSAVGKADDNSYVADYKVQSVKYEGDVAWVELQGVSITGKNITTVARMVLVDGRWMVDGNYTMLNQNK